jgi:hypothetical protein
LRNIKAKIGENGVRDLGFEDLDKYISFFAKEHTKIGQ